MYTRTFLLHSLSRMSLTSSLHSNCRNSDYPRSGGIHRVIVPDELVDWRAPWEEYKPINYTHPKVHGQPWADPDIENGVDSNKLQFNTVDSKVNRTSYMGIYKICDRGLPINPRGRTGLCGRGVLGKWGPNHAVDPIVTRWKTDDAGSRCFDPVSKRFILQFVAIQRGDCGEWALPGGMVDAGEKVTDSLKREFAEEALNSMQANQEERRKAHQLINEFFGNGIEIYKGYVDDPRNTDNSWMETLAMNFHDEEGDKIAKFHLHAGDDAVNVCWMDVGSQLKLYASHRDFLELVAKHHGAKW